MEYDPLVAPNLNTTGKVGLCLSFQEDVYGAAHWYDYAAEAWTATRYKHLDQGFPDVAVLIWLNYTATIEGVTRNWMHVATRLPDGRCFSSPWRQGTGSALLASIDEMSRIYGLQSYVGWSEDISNVRVAQPRGENMKPLILDANRVKSLALFILHIRAEELTDDWINHFVGMEETAAMTEMYSSGQWQQQDSLIRANGSSTVSRDSVLSYLKDNLK